MREGSKDRGHIARKAAWLTIGVLLFVPHVACDLAAKLDELILHIGERLYVWAHPCLFKGPRPPRRKR